MGQSELEHDEQGLRELEHGGRQVLGQRRVGKNRKHLEQRGNYVHDHVRNVHRQNYHVLEIRKH